MSFKVGDWVQLKHGGPVMKVIEFSGELDEEVRCMWHDETVGDDGNRRMRLGMFPVDTLQPYMMAPQPPRP